MRAILSLSVLVLACLVLAACGKEPPLYPTGYVTPSDPPLPPRRKPPVPSSFASSGAVQSASLSSGGRTSDPVESASLAPSPQTSTGTSTRPLVTPEVATPPASGRYRVAAGDTLYAVSRRFGTPIRVLIDANSLRPPYNLAVGQSLKVPSPRTHRVRPGETVYGISRLYGVEMSELMRANAISPPFTIAVGTQLVLPGASGTASSSVAARPEPEQLTQQSTSASSSPSAPPTPAPQAANTGTQEPSAAKPTAEASPPETAVPKVPARSGGKFLWPVSGRVVQDFGPQGSGRHNDGINILAPRGVPVHAAENGVVVYSGNQLQGFGNLLLVKHSDGWLTAYAHTQSILVAKGDTVERGQPIARVGSSGNVASPQLHFEVRKGKRAIDPIRILGPNPVRSSG